MSYIFHCPNCHVERPAATAICGRKVRCPDCFELVQSDEEDDLHHDLPIRDQSASDTVVLSELDIAAQRGDFDPYETWLGIPANEQPPHFYRLLDLPAFEPDSYVISGAADRQMAKLQAFDDDHDAVKERVIEELERARACLTDAEQKATYDRRLHKQFNRLAKSDAEKNEAQAATDVSDDKLHESAANEKSDEEPAEPFSPEVVSDPSNEDTVDEFDVSSVTDDAPDTVQKSDGTAVTAAPPPVGQPAPPVVRSESPAGDLPGTATAIADSCDDQPEEEADSAMVDFSERRTKFEAEMDMTPMVDVTFLLLIFFMVTASFSLQKSIEQPVQKQDKPSTNVTMEEFEDNPDFVVVQIDEFDTFRVIAAEFDEEAPSEQELLIMLRRARQGGGQVPTKLLVAAHGNTSHGRVVMAMDAGTEVGMEQVQFTLAAEGDL